MSAAERLPFAWVGGHPALDFTNTVSWNPDGLRQERLLAYGDLLAWVVEADLPVEPGPLRTAAVERPGEAQAALGRALELRQAIHRLFVARADGDPLPADALTGLDRALASSLAALGLEVREDRATWSWRGRADALDRVWWPIAWQAARLLAEPPEPALRRCANRDCGWLFLDRSRRGNRRWCEMATCGTRDKVRRFYARRR